VPASLARVLEVLRVSARLGLTSFGGPIAHLGYFHEEYVRRRQWLDERTYADLVALCQLLPGPASSQVGMAIGILRAGLPGAFAAWLGFTLPSAAALVAFAAWLRGRDVQDAGWLHGLLLAAVAVVGQAVFLMARRLAPDRPRGTIALAAAVLVLLWPSSGAQIAGIALGALAGWCLLPRPERAEPDPLPLALPRAVSVGAGVLFLGALVLLPVARLAFPADHTLALVDTFYRAGSLVFGGGHVVLPLLQRAVVPAGWVSDATFLAGYGAAQAVPGPLFTFAAYLGAVLGPPPHGLVGAALALVAIFLPGFLLVVAALPLWGSLRRRPALRAALEGIDAAVVGILLAALYSPVWTSAVHTPADFALALAAGGGLMLWRLPPWAVVLGAAAGGMLLGGGR
jgi:chromate transporter